MNLKENIPINIRRRYHLIGMVLYDLLQHIYPCEYNSSDHFVEGVIDELFYYIGNQPEFNGLDLMTVNDFILEHKYDELTDFFNEHCIVLKKDYLQENIQRIREVMGLISEVTNPYKVEWQEPTSEYFTQELSELLGNEMRFSKGEFFHPDNYDLMYSLFPHTFKMIAEHSKGDEVENEQEIKDILLNKEIYELMDDFGKFRHTLMKDQESQKEAFNFFKYGEMKVWKGTNPDTGEYVDNTDKTFYMGKVKNFMEWEPDYKDTTTGGFVKQYKDSEYKDQLGGYIGNIEQQRSSARKGEIRKLPAPFVIKLPKNEREGNEYILIGGHKRSAVALQMGIEPIKVWLIDLTK